MMKHSGCGGGGRSGVKTDAGEVFTNLGSTVTIAIAGETLSRQSSDSGASSVLKRAGKLLRRRNSCTAVQMHRDVGNSSTSPSGTPRLDVPRISRVRRMSMKEPSPSSSTSSSCGSFAAVSLLGSSTSSVFIGGGGVTSPVTATTPASAASDNDQHSVCSSDSNSSNSCSVASSNQSGDSSLRVSTILKRWNSHRERRLSANDAPDRGSSAADAEAQPHGRKLSAWWVFQLLLIYYQP